MKNNIATCFFFLDRQRTAQKRGGGAAKVKKQPADILYRLTDLYLALMLTVFLLWPGTGGYETITEEKASLFFLLSGVYTLGMVLLRLALLPSLHPPF